VSHSALPYVKAVVNTTGTGDACGGAFSVSGVDGPTVTKIVWGTRPGGDKNGGARKLRSFWGGGVHSEEVWGSV